MAYGDRQSFLSKFEARFEKKMSAFVLSSKHGLPLLLRQILEGDSFPDDNPKDFRHFHDSLGFPIFSFNFPTINDSFLFFYQVIKF